jgi:hypothetical protein
MEKVKSKRRSDIAKLVSHCREVWRQSEPYQKVKKLAKDPNRTGWFVCANCTQSREKIQVDHFEPIGKQPDSLVEFGPWLEKLFHSPQWGICADCHKEKSTRERKEGKYK